MIKIIAGVSANGVIGQDNKLPFDYPEDLKFFRKMTSGSTIIMGRKTYESIGRPLPKRRNIIVTTNKNPIDGVELASSFEEAIEMSSNPIPAVAIVDKDGKQITPQLKDNAVWLIGGANIYRQGLSFANEIYLTLIPDTIKGDNLIFFPWINPTQFTIESYINLENSELKVAKYVRT